MLTASCVEPSPTSLALEMLRFLVVDQDLQIVEVALTVIAPRPCKDFFKIWMLSLGLAHGKLSDYTAVDDLVMYQIYLGKGCRDGEGKGSQSK